MKKIYWVFIGLLVATQLIGSCKKIDDNYKRFIVPGGVSYVGKVEDPMVYNGRGRVKISWLKGADPKVSKARVFWNNFTDSVEIPISTLDDTVNVLIDNLDERTYAFVIKTYDEAGHTSVPVEVLGRVYGENYQASLLNRVVLSSIIVPRKSNGKVFIQWADADISNGAFANDITFEDATGKQESIRIPVGVSEFEIDNFESDATYAYRTLYLPDSLSIDTFYTEYHTQESLAVYGELPRENFRVLRLPTDAHDPNNPNDWALNKIWDGQVISPGGLAESPATPRWFSIDLGLEVTLTRFKLWQAPDRIYSDGNPRMWEVWGTNDPDADGGWDNWSLLTTCESIKPSKLPVGQNTEDDYARAATGEEYMLPQDTPPVRYIRFKIIESWEPRAPYTCIAEVAFFTFDK